MHFAKERRGSEKLVSAPNASPGRYYKCPTCSAEVFLRRGLWREPHFAHRSGQGKPDCENFHPSDDVSYSWPGYEPSQGSTNSYRPSDPLILSIELQPESTMRGKKLRAWELRLTVPKSQDEHGQITVDCGNGLKRTIKLAKLALGPQTCNVDVNAEDFGAIWVSPEVRPEYRAVVVDRIPGLDRDQASLFVSSTSRLKHRVDRVSWGGSYYLVWYATYGIAVPRGLFIQPLASNARWNCGLVTLPDDEDAEIRSWVERVTSVAISAPQRVFGLLYPPPFGLDILGRLTLPAGTPLVLGLKENEKEADNEVAFRAATSHASSQVNLRGPGRHVVHVEQDSNHAEISIHLDNAALPLLLPSSVPDADVFPGVRFIAREMTNRGRTEGSLNAKEGHILLEKVRSGHAEIFQCILPSGIKGTIRWKRSNEIVWSVTKIGQDDTQAVVVVGPDELAPLNKALQDRRCEVEVDFGAFGIFRTFSENVLHSTISRATRNRIYWLAANFSSFTNSNGVPLRRLSDAEIIQFVSNIHVPPQMAAHYRRVVAELKGVMTRGAVQ